MHPIPRSAADILASARSAPPKKSRKPAKVNNFASESRFTQFSASATASASTPSSVPVPFPNISTETNAPFPYIPPSTFKFIPTSTPDTILEVRREEGEELGDSHIADSDSGYFEESNSMSAYSIHF
jgi:hypothetical protein